MFSRQFINIFTLLLVCCFPAVAHSQPTFSQSFHAATIGPGSISTMSFYITNPDADPITELAFTNALPTAIRIATPAEAISECAGTLSAVEGGDSLSFSEGEVSASDSCTISVNVTASVAGSHSNTPGQLSSSAGSATATAANLIVDSTRPGFSKSFSPGTINLGERSTLTFTIDNSANPSPVTFLNFTDNLPIGMIIADPANISTTCTGVVTAQSGSSSISLSNAALLAFSTCTLAVDINANATGNLSNMSDELSWVSGTSYNGGKAGAVLEVTADTVHLDTSFQSDPVPAGDTVDFQFTISNFDRSQSATNISFTSDLNSTLEGLSTINLPTNDVCGAGSLISGSSVLAFTGGSLSPGATCTFSVTLQTPSGASAGGYLNTTSTIAADLVTGAAASDTLFIAEKELIVFTKSFTDNPVGSGGSVSLEFTITNMDSGFAATAISFEDILNDTIAGLAANSLVENGVSTPLLDICGSGSSLSASDPWPGFIPPNPTHLVFSGGNLASAGNSGDSCTFSITLDVPAGIASGSYLNSTSIPDASINNLPVAVKAAEDNLVVVAAPTFTKKFVNDPVVSGGKVSLEFTLRHKSGASAEATAISFTDDVGASLAGLAASSLPLADICGNGSQISGTSTIEFTGGTLAPGETCTFSIELDVPSGAVPGTYTNTTSAVSATVAGLAVTGLQAQDILVVSNVLFSKAFSAPPIMAEDEITLSFTIKNTSSTATVADISFEDNLLQITSGLNAIDLPKSDICGAGSLLSGASLLTLSGGSLDPGQQCSFSATLLLPPNTPDGIYRNITGNLFTGGLFLAPPAVATFYVGILGDDTDGDGIIDNDDNCPYISNVDQANNDNDSQGDICDPDDDNDTIEDTIDNCPITANTDQENTDNDSLGNACDLDDDNDTMPDIWELANGLDPRDASDAAEDKDGDGFTNQQEYGFGTDPGKVDADINKNGVPDSVDEKRGTIPSIIFLLNHS